MKDSEFTTLQKFSEQPTSLIETTFADTLGLSMHNSVVSQQNSQVQGNVAVANTMSRLLSISSKFSSVNEVESQKYVYPSKEDKKKSSIFSKFNFLK
jgi:hypothetical protein